MILKNGILDKTDYKYFGRFKRKRIVNCYRKGQRNENQGERNTNPTWR